MTNTRISTYVTAVITVGIRVKSVEAEYVKGGGESKRHTKGKSNNYTF